MDTLVIHCDGSSFKRTFPSEPNQFYVGWGIIAAGKTVIELYGSRQVPQIACQYCEEIAFVESLLYAVNNGYNLNNLSFYTDCQLLAYSPFFLHPGNYVQSSSETIKLRIKHLAKHVYKDTVGIGDIITEALNCCRIHWVKGHNKSIYNMRADYLSRYALYATKEIKRKFIKFNKWVSFGFCVGDNMGDVHQSHPGKTGDQNIWYPPLFEVSSRNDEVVRTGSTALIHQNEPLSAS